MSRINIFFLAPIHLKSSQRIAADLVQIDEAPGHPRRLPISPTWSAARRGAERQRHRRAGRRRSTDGKTARSTSGQTDSQPATRAETGQRSASPQPLPRQPRPICYRSPRRQTSPPVVPRRRRPRLHPMPAPPAPAAWTDSRQSLTKSGEGEGETGTTEKNALNRRQVSKCPTAPPPALQRPVLVPISPASPEPLLSILLFMSDCRIALD